MAKKVTPFPAHSVPRPPAAVSQSRVTFQIGSQRYAIDISYKATAVASTTKTKSPPSCGTGLLVQTRYLRLRKSAALGDCIDGWRVCWLGGWDKGKIFFAVMVKRTVPSGTKS
jgi:hypothetical protein